MRLAVFALLQRDDDWTAFTSPISSLNSVGSPCSSSGRPCSTSRFLKIPCGVLSESLSAA